MVACRAYTAAATSIANNTGTILALTAEELDTNAFHDDTTNNSRITIPTGLGGTYRVSATVIFTPAAAGRRVLKIIKNGNTNAIARGEVLANSASYATPVTASALVQLSAGDYLELQVVQDSGSSLALNNNIFYLSNNTTAYSAELSVNLMVPTSVITGGGGVDRQLLIPKAPQPALCLDRFSSIFVTTEPSAMA